MGAYGVHLVRPIRMLKIYSIVYNAPQFVSLQYNSFKNFIHDTDYYEFILIDNAPTPEISGQFHNEAKKLNLKIHRVKNPRYDIGGLSHQRALNYTLQAFIYKDSLRNTSLIVDSDIFLIRPCIPELMLNGHQLGGVRQGTEEFGHPWVGLLCFRNSIANLRTLNFSGALINLKNYTDYVIPDPALGWNFDTYDLLRKTYTPFDSGALIGKYITENQIAVKWFTIDFLENVKTRELPESLLPYYENTFNFWLLNSVFLHTGRMSNWDYQPDAEITRKNKFIRLLVEYCIAHK